MILVGTFAVVGRSPTARDALRTGLDPQVVGVSKLLKEVIRYYEQENVQTMPC